ncbi:MAG: AAA family ATPase [Bacteroidota bacterium]
MVHQKSADFTKYKFKALKTYTSTEWLADSKKKYRQVFDRNEMSYIFVEFSFFNKLFDEEEWETEIILKAYRKPEDPKQTPKEICQIDVQKLVSENLNIVYIRDGWPVDIGGEIWNEGAYYWEAYIEGTLVGNCDFYIYDVGEVTTTENPYLEVKSAQLYEGSSQDKEVAIRTYYNTFKAEETRFIWVEFAAKNQLTKDWRAELTFYFYNDARQLKAQTTELLHVNAGQDTLIVNSGWGSDHKGTWFTDNYTVEIVFMDTLIGVVPFRVAEQFIEGESLLLQPDESGINWVGVPVKQEEDEKTLEDVLVGLDQMTGLRRIKTRVREYAKYLEFLNLRKDKGFEDTAPTHLHVVLTGNPGTGKTSVARMLGQIYHKLGLLRRGHVHEVDRADIIGEYIGQTAPKMRSTIEKARGGVLFIDEAYALVRSNEDKKDYGREAIEILIKELSAPQVDFALIVAGYPQEMDVFLNSNPGLKSRLNLRFDFEDFTPEELQDICLQGASDHQVNFSEKAQNYLYKKLVEAYRNRDRSFGNARYALSLINEAKMNMGLRIMRMEAPDQLSDETISLIEEEDIREIFDTQRRRSPELPVDEELLQSSLAELNKLVGLTKVKQEIQDLIKLVRFYKEIGKDVLHSFSLHSVFTGNPGTGKTTVARIIGTIYRALGLLERGHVVEADRAAMVGKYVGETANKTAELIQQSQGGVLFIDEAYALTQGSQQDFGKEAVDTLLKRMEDLRGEMVVIVAGYPKQMRQFLESNPGLKSRFDRKFEFVDYSVAELLEIAVEMFQEEEITMLPEAEAHLVAYLTYLHRHKNKFFGNARAVRKLVEKAIKNQHLRLATLPPAERTAQVLAELVLSDVQEFEAGMTGLLEDGREGRVGFV